MLLVFIGNALLS
jgi:hypothetical protein